MKYSLQIFVGVALALCITGNAIKANTSLQLKDSFEQSRTVLEKIDEAKKKMESYKHDPTVYGRRGLKTTQENLRKLTTEIADLQKKMSFDPLYADEQTPSELALTTEERIIKVQNRVDDKISESELRIKKLPVENRKILLPVINDIQKNANIFFLGVQGIAKTLGKTLTATTMWVNSLVDLSRMRQAVESAIIAQKGTAGFVDAAKSLTNLIDMLEKKINNALSISGYGQRDLLSSVKNIEMVYEKIKSKVSKSNQKILDAAFVRLQGDAKSGKLGFINELFAKTEKGQPQADKRTIAQNITELTKMYTMLKPYKSIIPGKSDYPETVQVKNMLRTTIDLMIKKAEALQRLFEM